MHREERKSYRNGRAALTRQTKRLMDTLDLYATSDLQHVNLASFVSNKESEGEREGEGEGERGRGREKECERVEYRYISSICCWWRLSAHSTTCGVCTGKGGQIL